MLETLGGTISHKNLRGIPAAIRLTSTNMTLGDGAICLILLKFLNRESVTLQ